MKEIHKGHRALNLKPLSRELRVVYIDTLDDIYKAINARCFDVATRQIGTQSDKIYDIYCDDVGLYKDDIHLAAYGKHDCVLVGDILIAKHDKYGEMVDLTDEDIVYIKNHIHKWVDYDERELRILFPISYPNLVR